MEVDVKVVDSGVRKVGSERRLRGGMTVYERGVLV